MQVHNPFQQSSIYFPHPVCTGGFPTMLKDTACRLPHHRPTPPPFIFLKPQTGSGFLRPIFMRTSVAGMSRGNLPAKHAIVPAAHFYADIRCRHVSREPSSKTCHCSCGPCLRGHPLRACLAGTFQQNMPLFLQPSFMRTSVAGMPRRNLPAKHAMCPL